MKSTLAKLAVTALLAASPVVIGSTIAADAHGTGIHDNCTKLNQRWPHGVGRQNAVDRTSGTRVRNFYHNTRAYWAAENHNGTLDRDNDGIACEKR